VDGEGLLGSDRYFQGVWGLAGMVLTPADHAALASRLGVA